MMKIPLFKMFSITLNTSSRNDFSRYRFYFLKYNLAHLFCNNTYCDNNHIICFQTGFSNPRSFGEEKILVIHKCLSAAYACMYTIYTIFIYKKHMSSGLKDNTFEI